MEPIEPREAATESRFKRKRQENATSTSTTKGSTNRDTQFRAGLSMLYPRKSRRTLALLEKEKPLVYDDESLSSMGARRIQGMVEDLDRILFTLANGNRETASAVWLGLQRKRPFLTATKSSEDDKQQTTDAAIAQGVVEFLQLHHSGGRRPTPEQDAVDAVLTATCSSMTSTITNNNPPGDCFPLDKMASRLGLSQAKLAPYRQQALQRQTFVPKTRKTRSDCYRSEATECVWSFCHSEESSRPVFVPSDPCSSPPKYALRKVTNPMAQSAELHVLRIWKAPTLKERYQAFLQSQAYRDFVEANEGKSIGRTVFQSSLCPCVVQHHPKGKDRDAKPAAAALEQGMMDIETVAAIDTAVLE